MITILRVMFFALIVRPLVFVLLGPNVRRRGILPMHGPAILAANHNSHLDTMVLMSLLSLQQIRDVRSVASADYFFSNPLFGWFAKNIIGVIPIRRGTGLPREQVLAEAFDALDKGQIVIIYPEGTRGEPEQCSLFHAGIATLATLRPDVRVYPIYLHGLGKALPKDSPILVPFTCDVFLAPPIRGVDDEKAFMQSLEHKMENLFSEGQFSVYH
jgi:1-acyl-sn-glycerol-3-phosphate acyltransferase